MAILTDIRLQPNQYVIEQAQADSVPVTGGQTLTGIISKAYSNQMAFNVGEYVLFSNKNITYFTQFGVTYIVVNQENILFKTAYTAP